MASPFQRSKQAVDLAAPAVRVSRIRRDPPPPPPKVITAAEVREREGWAIAIGIAVLALALIVILMAVNNAAGWSPSQYSLNV